MEVSRYIQLAEATSNGKVLIIYGPRQVGKTTLLNTYIKETNEKTLFVSGEDYRTQKIFSNNDTTAILEFAEGYGVLIIDEAQAIENIGLGLKLLVDNRKNIKVIATGSSSFELSNQVGEPLVGRSKILTLFPVAQLELNRHFNKHELKENLEQYLIFGSYPEVITSKTREQKQEVISEIANAYLFKDILTHQNLRNSNKLRQILQLLAFQIGSEVSLNEIANAINLDVKTVDKYLDLLEKAFVIKSLSGFSRNLRSEVNQKKKYYFFDLGIRNAVISNYNTLDLRNDAGALWENFLFMERLKKLSYSKTPNNVYFWRTYQQKEIDLIQETNGTLFAFEFKWGKKQTKPPQLFLDTYENSKFEVINRDNYLDFCL
jgi:uncharacterized protein